MGKKTRSPRIEVQGSKGSLSHAGLEPGADIEGMAGAFISSKSKYWKPSQHTRQRLSLCALILDVDRLTITEALCGNYCVKHSGKNIH